ncbi:MAG: GNAT family N-acetyltransferase [Ottowia sp.]|nr:GNAT family N-acetyltransferase [Ottowia sp.]
MHPLFFRAATENDLAAMVDMLADDELGQTREAPGIPLHASYQSAFRAIQDDPNNELIVCERDGMLAGMLQITFIPSLTRTGSWRAQVEGVRVAATQRGQGIGRQLILHAVERARLRGCQLVQLTTDKSRPAALRFYETLGFAATHVGLKLQLPGVTPAPHKKPSGS